MNMFAMFDEIPAMTLQDIKETKRNRRANGRTHGRTKCKQYTLHKQSLRGYNNRNGFVPVTIEMKPMCIKEIQDKNDLLC